MRRPSLGNTSGRPLRSLVLLLLCASAYEVYEDEYANLLLPGHAGQTAEFPSLANLPYSVDANRLSDGVSSQSPLTSTSPAFPFHRGESPAGVAWKPSSKAPPSSASPGDVDTAPEARANLAEAKQRSEVEQGVAFDGAGAYVREQRVTAISASPGPAPSSSFIVDASLRWNPSRFAVQAGETYLVDVPGEQRWVDGFVKVPASGYTAHYDALSQCWVAAGRCRSSLAGQTKRLPDADWFSLVCGIGEYVYKLQETAKKARFMPLREDEVYRTLFAVGRSHEFRANFTGELICFANDADPLYWNNQGFLDVHVSRTSWPPKQYTSYDVMLETGMKSLPLYLATKLPRATYKYGATYDAAGPSG